MTPPYEDRPPIRADGLQLGDERAFQERLWRAERIAWCVFAAILLLALLGLTGAGGVFSRTIVTTEVGEIRHARVARWERADEMSVVFSKPAPQHRLVLSGSFGEHFQTEDIRPEPARTTVDPRGEILEFASTPSGSVEVRFYLKPRRTGVARFQAQMDAAPAVAIRALVLP